MTRSKNKNIVLGISWFSPEQWRQLKSISSDADLLDETYDAWMKNAEDLIKKLNKDGLVVRKVNINVSELAQWCTKHGREINGGARSEYVAEKVKEEDENTATTKGKA